MGGLPTGLGRKRARVPTKPLSSSSRAGGEPGPVSVEIISFDELTPAQELDRVLVHWAGLGGLFDRRRIQIYRRRSRVLSEYVGVFGVEDGHVLGQMLVLRLPYTFPDGNTTTVSGIAGVTTRVDAGRRGIGRQLLTEIHAREARAFGTACYGRTARGGRTICTQSSGTATCTPRPSRSRWTPSSTASVTLDRKTGDRCRPHPAGEVSCRPNPRADRLLCPIERFSSVDKLSSYVGLAPTTHQSGESEYHGHLKRDSVALLRWLLIEASWLHRHRVRRGTVAKVARRVSRRRGKGKGAVAGAHALLKVIFAMLKHREPFRTDAPRPPTAEGTLRHPRVTAGKRVQRTVLGPSIANRLPAP